MISNRLRDLPSRSRSNPDPWRVRNEARQRDQPGVCRTDLFLSRYILSFRPRSSLRRGEQSEEGSPGSVLSDTRGLLSFFRLFPSLCFPLLFPLSSPSRLTLAAALQLSTTHAPPSPLSPFVPPPSGTITTTVATFLEVLRGQPSSPWRVFALLPRAGLPVHTGPF